MFNDIIRDDVFRLETQRLWLRWPRLADAPAIARNVSDNAIAEMTARIAHPYPPEDAERYVFETRSVNADGGGLGLAITRKERPTELIGAIGVRPGSQAGEAEIGYWVGVPHWGQGFASEAVAMIVETVFTLSEVDCVIGSVRTNNPASRKVLEHNGFEWRRDETVFMPARGASHPVHWLALERVDWLARQGAVRFGVAGWSEASRVA